jgi:hypothetical protein
MTSFELVKVTLDSLYAEATAKYGGKTDATISARMSYLSTSYSALNDPDRQPVNYKDPATRFAYVFKYVATHSDYVVQVLQELRTELDEPIFTMENLRLSCIGGGPGSDIIGVLRYLHEKKKTEKVNKVTCYLLDREQAWADTWTELDDSMDLDVKVNVNFQPLDVTDPDSWAQQTKFLQADLFTMSYFVSEVKALDSDGVVSKFWKTLFKGAKKGALFLYDDNGSNTFNNYFDGLWKAAGLELVVSATNEPTWPRGSEQMSELGAYLKKFDQSPKLKTPLTYRVLRKP